MRYLLKAIVRWMDTRFPEKVTVTKADYDDLFVTLGQMNLKLQQLDQVIEQVKKLTADNAKFNVGLGFASARPGSQSPFER